MTGARARRDTPQEKGQHHWATTEGPGISEGATVYP